MKKTNLLSVFSSMNFIAPQAPLKNKTMRAITISPDKAITPKSSQGAVPAPWPMKYLLIDA
jgi:hypothetical protein